VPANAHAPSCALIAGSTLFSTAKFLRGPLSPIKTRQTRQIALNLLITLSKLMSGCSKKPDKHPTNSP
jgi:hypothetical protein